MPIGVILSFHTVSVYVCSFVGTTLYKVLSLLCYPSASEKLIMINIKAVKMCVGPPREPEKQEMAVMVHVD